MTYHQAIEYLYSKAPMFQNVGNKAYKEGLSNTVILDNMTGHPHRLFKCVHIAGTNGKGSVSHTIAGILQSSGLRVGLYTSPHLVDFRERIRINGMPIKQEFVVKFIEEYKDVIEDIKPSFFEITTAMAFSYFSESEVDIAVIETGLGGRLDCTNIIKPVLSIITNIGFDHTAYLGNTLEQIAAEKAGIIKPKTAVVIGEHTPETKVVFEKKARESESTIDFAQDNNLILSEECKEIDTIYYHTESIPTIKSELAGYCQKTNANTILHSVEMLRKLGFKITDKDILKGFESVIEMTGLRGRWQKVSSYPLIVCDTAHNSHGMKYIAQQLQNFSDEGKYANIRIVIGMVKDKDINATLSLLPKNAKYYFTQASVERSINVAELQKIGLSLGLHGNTYNTVPQAIAAARAEAAANDFIFVGGSTFVVADLLSMVEFYIQG